MLRLRKILLLDYIYYLILVVVILLSIIRLSIPKISNYNENTKKVTGIVINYKYSNNTLTITLKTKEKLLVYFYLKDNKNTDIKIGDKLKITGTFSRPNKNTTKNLFNYQKYLNNKKIYYIVNADSIEKVSSTKNLYYKIKQVILKNISSNAYLKAFILGDKSSISKEVITSYQENGISHLFAISGMHITLLSSIILKILKKIKIKEEKRYFITSIFLIFYLSLIGLSPSALRGVLFFILFSINKIYYFYIKPKNIFILVLIITLLINPYYIYDVGFQYSFSISLILILMSQIITGNYIQKLLKTSLLSFIVSIPISLFNYYQINILSIFYNLFYVPLVSYIIFPLSLLTFIFKPLLPVYNIFINILEKTSIFFNKITIGKITFPKLNIIVYLSYVVILIICLIYIKKQNKKPLVILISILTIHYLTPYLHNDTYIQMIDVGQGDSILIHLKNKNILIDTGGKETYSNKNNLSKIVTTITIPLLKSKGIRKIDYLMLTHGDYDHMGEAISLVENFKVEKVIFNCGDFNDLEKDLIKVLDKKKIPYYSCIKELNINDNKLYFLNNKDYGNENDNSSVIYSELNNHKFLFMGDAGVEIEKDLIKKYNLQDIDILKVGHHGSKTSSSKEFINQINPKYSIISVGKNNRYAHPNKEVLSVLEKSKIYRTDQDGSIMFKIKNNKLKIETCRP